jgi:sucrose-6-phosphate hydrolase SacC (GH32 family)
LAVKYEALSKTTQIFSPNSVWRASNKRIVVLLLKFSAQGRKNGRSLSKGERPLDTVGSDRIELRTQLDSEGADRYGLKIRSDPGGSEEALVYYDRRDEHVYVHREHSSADPETRAMYGARSRLVHSGPVPIDGPLELRVYLDRSMLEAYINKHRSVTTRLYPESDTATDVSVWSDGDIRVESISIWDLEGAGNDR